MKDIIIFPFGGNGLEALNCLGKNFNFIGFIDDTPEKQGKNPMGFTVYSRKILQDFPQSLVLAVPGSPANFLSRKKVIDGLEISPLRFATVIHPKAEISPMAKIGPNTLIMAGVILTSNCVVGSNVCILPNTVIHHDSNIGDYSLIGSNVTVAGNTTIEENCYLGSGVSIINGVTVGKRSLVGIGTNVIKNLPQDSKVVGNPARQL